MSFTPRSIEDLHLDFPPDLEHISASSINMLIRCEEQFRQVYILGKRKPPSLAMLTGRADHKAIELSMMDKIATGEDLPVNEVAEAFVWKLKTAVDEAGGLSELEVREGAPSYDEARQEGTELVKGYHRIVSPTVQPVAVEQEFLIEVPGVPVKLKGFIDLRTANTIIDRKRSKRAVKEASPDWKLQASIYQLVEPLPFFWHLSVPTKVPQFITDLGQPTYVGQKEKTQHHLRDAALKLGWLYSQFGPDEVWPATGTSHVYACNFCGFRESDCWAWRD